MIPFAWPFVALVAVVAAALLVREWMRLWNVSAKEHAAMSAKATQLAADLRQRVEQAERSVREMSMRG